VPAFEYREEMQPSQVPHQLRHVALEWLGKML